MGKGKGNIVRVNATSQHAFTKVEWLNQEWVKREAEYLVTMILIREWLRDELISREEFIKVNEAMVEKYHPKISCLLFL